MHTQANTCMTHLHTDTPLHFQPKKDGLSSTDCESLAAAITSTQCAENFPAKSAFPVTHTMGRASRKCPLIPLSPTTTTRRGGGRKRRPRVCPGRLPIRSSVFGLRSRYKKSHPIPSKSALQSGNGSLGSPFVPWAVPEVYHISLTNCKIHIDSFSSFYIFKSAACKRFASRRRRFNYKITLSDPAVEKVTGLLVLTKTFPPT